MSARLSANSGIIAAIVIAFFIIAFAEQAAAQSPCPAGKQPATIADIPIMQTLGITDAHVGECWNPNDFGGEAADKAKQYLMTLLRTSNQCMAPQMQIAGLNGPFSICAARFLQAFSQQYGGSITITRAYFTTQCEASLCTGNDGCGALKNNPSPVSNHTRGLAMDVTASVGTDALAQFAQANPQFGVCFPFNETYTHKLSFTDNVHMILAGIPGSEPNGPGCSNVKAACSGSGYNPNSITVPPIPAPVTPFNYANYATPGILGAMQNPLLMSPPPLISASPFAMNPLVASQPTQSCAPRYFCSANAVYYESDSCVTQIFQQCQYGCTGTVCSPPPAASSTLQTLTNSNFAMATTATSSMLSLNTALSQLVQENGGSQNTSVITIIATGSGQYAPQIAQSTFSSSGFSGSTNIAPSPSPIQQVLSNLRAVLIALLNYLHLFGTQTT